ncbi:hypothetical protein, partial [Mariniflexile sp.]
FASFRFSFGKSPLTNPHYSYTDRWQQAETNHLNRISNMKKIIFILLFFPHYIISQSSSGFFNFSKDEFYIEKMDEWNQRNVEKKFETLINNDTVFAFSAKFYSFQETFQLNLGKNKKIEKIENFIYVHNGSLDELFPYKYPIKIGDIFKNLGNPDVTNSNSTKLTMNTVLDLEYSFEKYYKWNNVLYRDTKVSMEIANLKAKKSYKNKKGKIKKYQFRDYGYVSYTANSNGTISDNDKNFNTVSLISNGAIKSWQKTKREMISLLGEKRFNTSNLHFENNNLPYFLYLEKTNDPSQYFKNFFFFATMVYDIAFGSQVLEENQKYTYTTLPDNILAEAIGMDKSCCIEILIDLENWNNSTYLDKLFIMFHEFGHDIFNLKHSDGIRLMATNKLTFDDPSILGEMIHEMMLSILKRQKTLNKNTD